MFQPRCVLFVILALVMGCHLSPTQLTQLLTEGLTGTGPSVADVAPDIISDPNDPARGSPAATQAPIRVRLSNPTPRDADCRVTMEIIGRDVHFSLRRILAATQSIVIGPDQADIVIIEATFLGEPPAAMEPQTLRINRDFAPGDTIDFVLTLPPPVGACCFDDGTCALLTADECAEADGQYQGDDTSCDPNPCPPPPAPEGACCFDDGTCELLTTGDCTSAGGQYQGDDTSCDPNPCPPPPAPEGACCFDDGTCELLTDDECASAGGQYQGDDTSCDPNPCPQPEGACCFENGMCEVLTAEACTNASGQYQGDGIVCDPNPCPVPLICPDDALFSQPIPDPNDPNAFLTYDISETDPIRIRRFENIDGATGDICGIHWWGFMLDELPDEGFTECFDPAFEIGFYRSIDGQPDPNDVFCSYVVTPTIVPTGQFYNGLELQYFSVDQLDSCCPIDENAAWISIQGLGDTECWFYWASSDVGDGFSVYDVDGDLVFDTIDFSVCLTGTYAPILGACCVGDDVCELLTQAECWALDKEYLGDGTVCDPNPCLPPPPGRDCTDPIVIVVPNDLPYSASHTTCGLGNSYDDTCLSPNDVGEDIIFMLEVVEPVSVDITVDPGGTPGTGFALAWDCPPFKCVNKSEDPDGQPHGIFSEPLSQGTYYIMVDSWTMMGCIPTFDLTVVIPE